MCHLRPFQQFYPGSILATQRVRVRRARASLSTRRLEANLLSVCVTTVPNRDNIDQALSVGYSINDSPVAYPDAPEIRGTFKLFHAARTRLDCESLDALEYPDGGGVIQRLKFFTR